MQTVPKWSVAIFSARESVETLMGTVGAAITACGAVVVVIDVLVNGNRQLAEAAKDAFHNTLRLVSSCTVRLWFVEEGDKGHTWNQLLHAITVNAELAFFIGFDFTPTFAPTYSFQNSACVCGLHVRRRIPEYFNCISR